MEFKNIEANAIRAQVERTQHLEHSAPLYLTSRYVFEDAEDMRTSFSEEKEREETGIYPGLVRVSVGLEPVDDIIKDLKQSLNY